MFRVGIGYDMHRLAEGYPLVLGGVTVPHPMGLEGHSDADVLIHAIMDALLGAMSHPDIGQLFPDNDPRYENISSLELLEEVVRIMSENNYRLVNMDSVIIAQQPKLTVYLPAMKENLARVLDVELGEINIKATTNEGLDAVGNEKGIAAQAVAMLRNLSDSLYD